MIRPIPCLFRSRGHPHAREAVPASWQCCEVGQNRERPMIQGGGLSPGRAGISSLRVR